MAAREMFNIERILSALGCFERSVCLVSRFHSGLVGYAEPPYFLNAASFLSPIL